MSSLNSHPLLPWDLSDALKVLSVLGGAYYTFYLPNSFIAVKGFCPSELLCNALWHLPEPPCNESFALVIYICWAPRCLRAPPQQAWSPDLSPFTSAGHAVCTHSFWSLDFCFKFSIHSLPLWPQAGDWTKTFLYKGDWGGYSKH